MMEIISHAAVLELLDYDPIEGTFRYRRDSHKRVAGELAGGSDGRGYLSVRINYRNYQQHRLAWFYVYGEWPAQMVDHKDGNPTNNKIANLRLATPSQNSANSRPKRRAKSKGAYFCNDRQKWSAAITVNKKCHWLGYFADERAAYAAYCEAAHKHFGEYARIQ